MTTIETTAATIEIPTDDFVIDDAQLAAVAFLARYSGRTLDAYRHDLRGFFQWAADKNLAVLAATRPHIELYRSWMEERGLAASTIDRRLSTVCGFYRFAHIDGRIASNPAQYVRRPQVHPSTARGLDRSELGVFLFTAEQLRPRPRRPGRAPRPQRAASQRGVRHQHRGPRDRTRSPHAAHPRQGQQARHHPARPAHRPHRRPRCRRTTARVRSCAAATGNGSTGAPRTAGSARSASEPGSAQFIRTCFGPRSSWPPSTPAYRCVTCRLAARHADPRTTTIYDRRRQNFDRHAAYVVVAFVAGG